MEKQTLLKLFLAVCVGFVIYIVANTMNQSRTRQQDRTTINELIDANDSLRQLLIECRQDNGTVVSSEPVKPLRLFPRSLK
jgi:hypothetical protein